MFNLADRLEYQGVSIIKTNHLPNANYGQFKIGESRYNRTFNVMPVKALIWQQGCIASLKMMGLKVDQVDDIRRNTVFTVASMMAGTGVMKPEHAAICVGQPGGGTTTGSNCVFADATNAFGNFAFDSNNDLLSFQRDAHGDSGPFSVTLATTPTLNDDNIREMARAAYGAAGLTGS